MDAESRGELSQLRARNALLEEALAALRDLWAWQSRLKRAASRVDSLRARRELDAPLAAAMARLIRALDALGPPRNKGEGREMR